MSFPDIPAGEGVVLIDTDTGEPQSTALQTYLDQRYVRGNTTTDSASLWDGTDDITIWRPPGTPGSVTVTAGSNFTLANNNLYIRNGFLLGTIEWTRTSSTLTHGDIILTLETAATPDHDSYAVTGASPANSYIFPVSVNTDGEVVAQQPPTGRTDGKLRFVVPLPLDYT